jgi:hypothetical protein
MERKMKKLFLVMAFFLACSMLGSAYPEDASAAPPSSITITPTTLMNMLPITIDGTDYKDAYIVYPNSSYKYLLIFNAPDSFITMGYFYPGGSRTPCRTTTTYTSFYYRTDSYNTDTYNYKSTLAPGSSGLPLGGIPIGDTTCTGSYVQASTVDIMNVDGSIFYDSPAAPAAEATDFVYPVLGVPYTDPSINIIDPLVSQEFQGKRVVQPIKLAILTSYTGSRVRPC